MTHKLIKTENYLLIVDDSEIKVGDWIRWNNKITKAIDTAYTPSTKKIIAHLPFNHLPILKGVPLLPSYSRHQDDGLEELAEYYWKMQYIMALDESTKPYIIEDFKAGYNKAREKYKYTEEDMRKAIDMARPQGFRRSEGYLVKHTDEEIIQSLSQYPTEFETEDVKDYSSTPKKGFELSSFLVPKTITTSQGIQWVGKYI